VLPAEIGIRFLNEKQVPVRLTNKWGSEKAAIFLPINKNIRNYNSNYQRVGLAVR